MEAALSPVFGCLPRLSLVDYPDRLAAVVFVAGCNFRCGFCHNAALLGPRRPGVPWAELTTWCRRWRDDWATGLVITGGEPTFREELPELIQFVRRAGFSVKLDTNGSYPERLAAVLPAVDYVAMDIKCSLARYPEVTGFAEPAKIAAAIALIKQSAAHYEFRTTILESLHDDAEMRAIGELVRGAQLYVLQPFVPREEVADAALAKQPRTAPARLRAIRQLLTGTATEVLIRGE